MLKLRFELEDFEVAVASAPDEAQRYFHPSKPDMCIIDITGIKGDGLDDAQNFIKSVHPNVPGTILLTSVFPDSKKFHILHEHQILKKPYDLTTLVKIVSGICKSS